MKPFIYDSLPGRTVFAVGALGRVGEHRPAGSADVPGVLVPPDDSRALAAALRAWLTDAGRLSLIHI